MKVHITTIPNPENQWGIRHLIGIMGFFSLALLCLQKNCLNLAITEMVRYQSEGKIDALTCPIIQKNTTSTKYAGEFNWDEETQGLILSSYFWGSPITLFPGGLMVERWGVKWVLGISVFLSTIATIFTPLISRTSGPWGLICLRILIGCSQGPVHPALHLLLTFWSSVSERGRLAVVIFAGTYLGTFISMAMSGMIISYFSWTGVFYIYGGIGMLWCIGWMIVYYDTPFDHPFIKEDEKTHITTNSGKICYDDLPPTPWIPILTSAPLWGLIIAEFGHNWGLNIISVDLSTYMETVLHVSVKKNAFISGLPHLAMWLFSFIFGWAADVMIVKFKWDITLVRKILNTVATTGPALGIIVASYCGCDATVATVFFVFGMAMMSAYIPSLKVNALDLSSHYAGTVFAMAGGIGAISGILSPNLTAILTPHSTLIEWRLVFWITFILIICSNIAFLILGTANTQWWDNPDKVRRYHGEKMKDNEETTDC